LHQSEFDDTNGKDAKPARSKRIVHVNPPFNPEFGDLNEYYAFKSCLYVFFFFQLLHVCEILYIQSRTSIIR
jgi:hypothetical protein